MSAWPFAPGDRPSKIVCVGRNYAAHAGELGNVVPDDPILFLKPPSSLLPSGAPIRLPPGIGAVHHEVELGVVIGRRLSGETAAATPSAIRGWCLGIDLTARDLQAQAKKSGRPWTMAKGYDTFCPCSHELPATGLDPRHARLELSVDDELRQSGDTGAMVWSVPDLLAYISTIMTLEPGDLVLTGTPEGVGPIEVGQTVTASLDGTRLLQHDVVARE